MTSNGTGARFDTTHWSVVLAAGGDSTSGAKRALATLCETYWYPLYAYLRRQGQSAEDAQDLTQGSSSRSSRRAPSSGPTRNAAGSGRSCSPR